MHYTKFEALPEYCAFSVGDSFPENVFSESGDPEIDNRVWTVEHSEPWQQCYNGPTPLTRFGIVVVSTPAPDSPTGKVYMVMGEGDWLGCNIPGHTLAQALALELMRTEQWLDIVQNDR